MEKNMDKVNSTGSACLPKIQNMISLFSISKAAGGVVCLTDQGLIKSSMAIFILDNLRTALNMEMARNGTPMEIFTTGNSSTECPMAMGSTAGLTAACFKGTSVKDCAMVMECGRQAVMPSSLIRATTSWTRRVAMEYIIGRVDGVIEATLRVIIERAMANCTTAMAS
jgi:hypothetical protein